jgi:glycosyltransferase involved in cell wall biosynthesis
MTWTRYSGAPGVIAKKHKVLAVSPSRGGRVPCLWAVNFAATSRHLTLQVEEHLSGPLVSIIIDNYNYGRFLSEAIESAIGQSYPNTEVIVVDDGSSDDSRRVIGSYDRKIIPVLKQNGGQASAFNAGFRVSRGEVVMFLDADDRLLNRAAEQVVRAWKPELAKIQFYLECVDAGGQSLGFSFPGWKTAVPPMNVRSILLETGFYNSPPTSGNAFSRRALDAVLPIDEDRHRIAADNYLFTTTPFYGDVLTLREVLGQYRIHGSNTWLQNSPNLEKFHSYILCDYLNVGVVVATATRLGMQVPPEETLALRQIQHIKVRLASLRLDPKTHPLPADRPLKLALRGIIALWRWSDIASFRKRIAWTLWLPLVAILPAMLARPLISWALVPRRFLKRLGQALT